MNISWVKSVSELFLFVYSCSNIGGQINAVSLVDISTV